MRVNEIFYSIEGEGVRAGAPATFVRFAGCNLRCSYCDTTYAFHDGTEMLESDIVKRVCEIGCNNVTVTGGEPLLQGKRVVKTLCNKGFQVNVETCGALDITDVQLENSIVTMDYKTPSSGMEDKMLLSNIPRLRKQDVLKFVCEESDFNTVKNIYEIFRPKCNIYLSPVFNKCDLAKMAELVKEMNEPNIKMQVQLHKIVWDPDKRGV